MTAFDVTILVEPHHLEAIRTPHAFEHEPNHRPVWIIWRVEDRLPPAIDCIADSEDLAIFNLGSLIFDRMQDIKTGYISVHVERVPCNHRFASSLKDIFDERALRMERRLPYRREGD